MYKPKIINQEQRGQMCLKKHRYRDKKQAIAAIRGFEKHSTRDIKPTRAYKCPVCNGYHITSVELRSSKDSECASIKN